MKTFQGVERLIKELGNYTPEELSNMTTYSPMTLARLEKRIKSAHALCRSLFVSDEVRGEARELANRLADAEHRAWNGQPTK